MRDISSISTTLSPSEILTLFFVTLGPIKILAPFARRTRDFPARVQKQIAMLAFVLATAAIAAGGFLGQRVLGQWHVSVPVLMVTAGIVLFAVALRQVLQQYESASPNDEALPASPLAAATRLVFPLIITPYGVAAVIVLLAESDNNARTGMILGILVFVMCLNLLAMLLARRILVAPVVLALQLLGTVLAVLQVALAVQFILVGWRVI